ncbi:SusC/RagA family TonB-linked outer membrane protein [Chitinophaga horti]|uniref:SusC/RagA family TonB-linked outer membrane protein n=1 Tax=Chitinophaga horti TaxID=2920382 RepID=A0ABY6J448_9BACT|nr:SusC/RagA family TonB-linked outer membrane protein [Chitinophaga horti]UYQ94455.1 SusC/RagA family TonB-linked outer membrane protein [Chitinophaga horti]
MKLTVILLTAVLLQVQATGFSQSVTISGKDVPLKKIFDSVEKQTGYVVFYKREVLQDIKPVSVSVRDMSLAPFLDLVLADAPLSYLIEGKTIYLSEKKRVASSILDAAIPPPMVDVRGVVKNKAGELLAGATVRVIGLGGTTTSTQGTFEVLAMREGMIMQVSVLGYSPMELKVVKAGEGLALVPMNASQAKGVTMSREGNAYRVNIVLEIAISSLGEVVVNKGYYTESQRLSTGSVASVDAKAIEKQPITNVLQALQGRMPGLSIVQANGFPGSAFAVQVRGVNSMARASLPLYVIDGVPFLSEAINAQTGTEIIGANGSTNPLNSISPSDIEKIEVLKDGDATAIYGSRGANGVILITTKKGRAGKTRLDLSVNSGVSNVMRMMPTLKTPEYLEMRKLGFQNSGETPSVNNAPDLVTWDQNAYTDFQELLIGNTAKATDANITLSGGDARTNFLLSGSYHHETTVYYMDKFYKRGSANFSVNHRSLDEKLQVGFSAMYVADNNTLAVEDLTSRAYQLAPNFPLYNPDGSLYFNTFFQNPLGAMMRTNRNKSSNLNSSLTVRYKLADGLDLKVMGGFGRADMDQTQLTPRISQDPTQATAVSRAIFAYGVSNNYIVEPQLNFERTFGKGKLSALVGGSWQYRKSRQPFYTLANDFTSDDFLENISSAATVSTRSSATDYKFASLLARVNYVYNDRYVLNGVFRRDGSSRFGPNNRFGNFGSIGAAWIFSDEPFMAGQDWLSNGKLRGSFGITGSDNIGNYMYLDSYSSSSYNYNGYTGLVPTRIANNDFRWEETQKAEVALELGFLNDRIRFTPAYYQHQSSNQLINYTISAQAGFSSYQANLPATVQNSGWEFTLSTSNITKKDFTWTSNFNLSANRNKLKSFPNIRASSYYTSYIVGNPLSSVYTYQYTGIDATTGLPTVADLDKNNTISFGLFPIGRGDRDFYGTNYPKFFGGFNNAFTYKQFALDFMLQFVKQEGSDILTTTSYAPGYILNLSEDALERYIALEPVQKRHVRSNYNVAFGNLFSSDIMRVDASFIRLKNVAISYDLPAAMARKIRLSAARVYVQGQNLLTLTSYKGFDPETQGLSLPPLRTITAGLKISL